MRLIIQPGDGVETLLEAIRKAKTSIEMTIFRFDRPEIECALAEAVERRVFVHTLIASTNRGGEESLRRLERRFLARGITVARTADDLVRYHGKMIVFDRQELYLLGFNFTQLDIERSRSLGLITRDPDLVKEAMRLFEADSKRQDYSAKLRNFLVSPVNARRELARFIKGARQELLIYDPKVRDPEMLALLRERRKAGVKVRVIGSVNGERLASCELRGLRLHTRTMIRDRAVAFLGSQSLRRLELDQRREIGLIFREPSIVRQLVQMFDEDWQASSSKSHDQKVSSSPGATKKTIIELLASPAYAIPFPSLTNQVRRLFRRKRGTETAKISSAKSNGGLSANRNSLF